MIETVQYHNSNLIRVQHFNSENVKRYETLLNLPYWYGQRIIRLNRVDIVDEVSKNPLVLGIVKNFGRESESQVLNIILKFQVNC